MRSTWQVFVQEASVATPEEQVALQNLSIAPGAVLHRYVHEGSGQYVPLAREGVAVLYREDGYQVFNNGRLVLDTHNTRGYIEITPCNLPMSDETGVLVASF
jgi:hypothetical protein